MNLGLFGGILDRLTISRNTRRCRAQADHRGFQRDGESSALVRSLAFSLLPLVAVAWSDIARADGILTVQASVPASCSVNSPILDFGTYISGQTAAVTAQQDILVTCSNSASVTVKLGPGNNVGDNIRRMTKDGGGDLEYNLFKENTFSNVWGDDSIIGTSTVVNTKVPRRQSPFLAEY